MLRKIHPSHQSKAVFLLQLLLDYGESVELNALVDALAINVATKSFDESDRMPRPTDILMLCPGFIEQVERADYFPAEKRGQYIQFAHYSVKEYLQSDRGVPQPGKDFMYALSVRNTVQASLISLMKLPPVSDVVRLGHSRPWIECATNIFVRHAREAEDEDTWITRSFCRFLLGRDHVYNQWIKYIGRDFEKFWRAYTDCPLHFAALIGMSKCVKMMHQSQSDHGTSSALDKARLRTVTDMLLEYSPYTSHFLNRLIMDSYTPLGIASRSGHANAVESLLHDRQCMLQEQSNCESIFCADCQAPYVAASKGYVEVVRILLEHGADGPKALVQAAAT